MVRRGRRRDFTVEPIYEVEEEIEDSDEEDMEPIGTGDFSENLKCCVQTWHKITNRCVDIVIHVENRTFFLHSHPLTSRSGYMKRHLKESNNIRLDDIKITAHTFDMVIEFCYGSNLPFTPQNIAALRCAAEILEMTEEYEVHNLCRRTKFYFSQVVTTDKEVAEVVLYKSLELLPESENGVFLVSQCIETLLTPREIWWESNKRREGNGGHIRNPQVVSSAWVPSVVQLSLGLFEGIMRSVQTRLIGSHDGIYAVIDAYLKEHKEMTVEEKNQLSRCLDCGFLSAEALMHAVQNPKMPLIVVVQALFAKQIKLRQLLQAESSHYHIQETSLGDILSCHAAHREVAQLEASINTTYMRIASIERDLFDMKKKLEDCKREELVTEKSASFRVVEEELSSYIRERTEKESFARSLARNLKAFGKNALKIVSQGMKEGASGEIKQYFHRRHRSFS
ncbi:BTB/POZ domain-containing protein At3g49900 [Amborella trichopoda]|nr:BTB/POZ domain-containing protein At3g49900 [Amborella trichopoda]|eukprot:XP_011622151.1 BTB/POZ domain-containing protein At3g49900 [Amborella trichopoda]